MHTPVYMHASLPRCISSLKINRDPNKLNTLNYLDTGRHSVTLVEIELPPLGPLEVPG